MHKYIIGIVITIILFVIVYAVAPTNLRVVNANSEYGEVNVYYGDKLAYTSLPFKGRTGFTSEASGEINVKLTKGGMANVIVDTNQDLRPSKDVTLIFADSVIPVVDKKVKVNDKTVLVRIIHASGDTGMVDVYNGEMTFNDVSYGEDTRYKRYTPGIHTFSIVDDASFLTVATETFDFIGGNAYSIVLLDNSEVMVLEN